MLHDPVFHCYAVFRGAITHCRQWTVKSKAVCLKLKHVKALDARCLQGSLMQNWKKSKHCCHSALVLRAPISVVQVMRFGKIRCFHPKNDCSANCQDLPLSHALMALVKVMTSLRICTYCSSAKICLCSPAIWKTQPHHCSLGHIDETYETPITVSVTMKEANRVRMQVGHQVFKMLGMSWKNYRIQTKDVHESSRGALNWTSYNKTYSTTQPFLHHFFTGMAL